MFTRIAAALLIAISADALADEIAGGKIQVRIPNGWTAETIQVDDASAVALVAPDYNRTGAACLLATTDDAGSSGKAQQELNLIADEIATEPFWKEFFSRPGVTNIVVIARGSKIRGGRSVPFAKASYDDVEDGAIVATDALQLVPGRMLIVDCNAKAAAYPAAEASFDVVIGSFGPLGGDVVASLSRPTGQVAFLKDTVPPVALQALIKGARARLRRTDKRQ
ncbi:MAG: hypothetical protein KBA31_06970 [Alphaproteobacteria bacterium]|nr:hypothetical protein [Alphaproteobacteria bacterium]